ncbi:hypothetical protein [Williamsia sterculiae]|uniref:Uncharacterized protein n=1 Tax=Williamsia sterculiae TaxID=1344003 RepID=A0A1N7DU27_9NOCA|nr:hypothetical protein [Williamsia sterculiae]SIR79367.1 hypothetical protein SAMN05445060_0909 [Williamsia sterculiae]
MRPADQIEAAAAAAVRGITDAERAFHAEQRRIAALAQGPGDTFGAPIFERLQREADIAAVTPQVLLPVDEMGASPHSRTADPER